MLVGKNNDQESFWMEVDHITCDENHMTRFIHANIIFELQYQKLLQITFLNRNDI